MLGILNGEIILSLVLAMALGICLGFERNLAGKVAGMRTFALVSLGAALFAIISKLVTEQTIGIINFDPLRMASQVIVGIGFLGAGLIMSKAGKVTGLTTAAGMWVAAGVGLSCGFGLYWLALVATGLILFIFAILWIVERDFVSDFQKKTKDEINDG
ncbi:MAG: MgtC/SapB family protein [Candidatus Paceibacterota bacterium]|jgi:putative Mg2+ transporter-C (MgtC) family protein